MPLQQWTIWEDSGGGDGENSALCRMERICNYCLIGSMPILKCILITQNTRRKERWEVGWLQVFVVPGKWTQQEASCQSRLFAMHSGQFIICSLDLMQICKMKSIYDDVEQLIEMQKANAVCLKNGIVQPHTYIEHGHERHKRSLRIPYRQM